MVIHGGVNIPYSLTAQEAYAAGVNQIQVLEQKRLNSPEYKEMLIGVGFFTTAMSMLGLCVLTMWRCPTYVIAPEESDTTPPNTIP